MMKMFKLMGTMVVALFVGRVIVKRMGGFRGAGGAMAHVMMMAMGMMFRRLVP